MEDNPVSLRQSHQHSTTSWRKNPHRLLTVEVVIFLYITGILLEIPVIQQYLYYKARQELKINETEGNDTVCNPYYKNSSEYSTGEMVEKRASQYILLVNIALTVPAMLTACFLGTWSDEKGRKGPMIVTSIGSSLASLTFLLAIYWNLPIYVFMIASSLAGLGGYYPTMVLAILAYVADTSQPDSRAMRLGILEAIAFVCGTVVSFSSGVWIKNYGYESVYLVILTVHLLNLVYVVIFLPESLPPELKKNTAVFSVSSVKNIVLVYFKKRLGRWVLFVLLICTVIVFLTSFVIQTLLVLYGKRAPLCWESSIIGYFLGTWLFSKAIGAVVGISLCSRLGISNFGAIQLGVFFLMGNLLMIGLSRTTLEMFLSNVLAFFTGVPQPCIRAEMSRLVNKEEQGALFAILASLESLCNFSSQLIFNPLYTWTVTELTGEFVAGITFFINAGLLLIPVVLIGVVQYHKPGKRKEFSPLVDDENPVS